MATVDRYSEEFRAAVAKEKLYPREKGEHRYTKLFNAAELLSVRANALLGTLYAPDVNRARRELREAIDAYNVAKHA